MTATWTIGNLWGALPVASTCQHGRGNNRVLGQVKIRLAIIFLCCLFPAGTIFGSGQPVGKPFQLEFTPVQLLGEEEASRYEGILDPDKRITWEVYLPENEFSEPPGVFVYVSPRRHGRIDTNWRAVMDNYNLIWIGANRASNRMPVTRRMVYALLALKALEQDHLIDASRITVSGLSGGGRVASMLASQYPEIFTGAIFICGVNFWGESLDIRVDRLVQNRFVFLTGTKDFNLIETKGVYQNYLNAGAVNSKLMVIPGMSHEHPDAKNLSEALDFIYE